MSPPEAILWRLLRDRHNGLKFRRQHPLGPFVLDFYCREAALTIEIDGFAHGCGNYPVRDEARDKWVANQGILTLRIDASEVRDNLEGVLTYILEQSTRRTPPPPSAVPLPSKSRGGF